MTSFLKAAENAGIGSWLMKNAPAGFLLIAIFYNTLLAVINWYVTPLSAGHVIFAEILIVVAGFLYIAIQIRSFQNLSAPLFMLLFFSLIFLYVSVVHEVFYLKSIRDILLIVLFFMLGSLISKEKLIAAFRFIAATMFVVMMIEIFFTDIYVDMFHPAVYYQNTRGVEVGDWNASGLFGNSLGFPGRFSFGFLSTHRVSSVFLEQVSLANFVIVLAIFLCTFWKDITKADRALFAVIIIIALTSNSTRTGSFVVAAMLIGYFIFPLLPRFSTLLYMPVILLLAFIFFYDPQYQVRLMEDNLSGRVGRTTHFLSNMGHELFMGGTLRQIYSTPDSGYAYVIFTQTVFGLIVLWLFCTYALSQNTPQEKRFAHGLNLSLFMNMLIGSAIFTIKVTGPLWMIAGYFYYKKYKDDLEDRTPALT